MCAGYGIESGKKVISPNEIGDGHIHMQRATYPTFKRANAIEEKNDSI